MWALAQITFAIFTFFIFFFRDPEREIPEGKNLIVSPADGKIKYVKEVKHDPDLDGPAKIVYIFLYPWNVHINRAPISGRIASIERIRGKHRPAFMKSAILNHQNKIKIKFGERTIIMFQIVGVIARRIKCWASSNQKISTGEKIGMILFGSGTKIVLPANTKILVRKGDKIKAGETIIGKLK